MALDEAFTRLYPWLIETARRVIRSRAHRNADVEVAVADVVGDLYEDWAAIVERYTEARGSVGGYLNTIIHRKQADRWRRTVAQTHHLTPGGHEMLDAAPARSDRLAPEDLVQLQTLLDALSEEEQELIDLKFGDDLTFQEIAQRRDVPLSRAYRELVAVIEKLRLKAR